MPMPPYPVLCSATRCTQAACFKIAARWSDGETQELKTYSLACARCVATLLTNAHEKRATCRLASGESLEEPGVYELHHGYRDRELKRRTDQERSA